MAEQNLTKQGTLLDVMNQIGPDGNLLAVAEVLQKETPIMKDAVWVEANDTIQHIYSQRTSLPASEKLKFNKGVSGKKGTTKQMSSTIMSRGNRPYYDKRLVDLAPNKQEYRNMEARAVIMGIGQEFDQDIIYASKAGEPESFDGIQTYVSALSNEMVLGGTATSSTSAVTSAYLVCWDTTQGVYMAYPRGSKAGVRYEDKGMRAKDMDDGSTMEVYEDYVEVSGALCVANPKAVGRYANIDISDSAATTAFSEDNIIRLLNKMPASLRSKCVIYVSPGLMSAIEIKANNKDNAYYTAKDVFGETLTHIRQTPVRLDEMISEKESIVS